MKRLTPIFIFLLFLTTFWIGHSGIAKFHTWTVQIGIRDTIIMYLPYIIGISIGISTCILMVCLYYMISSLFD